MSLKNLFYLLLICITYSSYSQKIVTGEVYDASTNKPLKDVEVTLSIEKNKVVTDKKGKFKINIKNEKDTISFFQNNYSSAKTPVGNAKKIKVVLFPNVVSEKNVEIGYGTQKESSLTSAVTVLSTEDFNKGYVSDIYQYMRGKVPGLYVKSNAQNPNEKPIIYLRGAAASFSENKEPLIIIDGVQNGSLQNLDPNDVATITVLRDGSSQAMYGSQASGGVILIKTKRK